MTTTNAPPKGHTSDAFELRGLTGLSAEEAQRRLASEGLRVDE